MNSTSCKAPMTNMYFTVKGEVSPCWLTVGAVDTWSPDRSIHDIWFGSEFAKLNINLMNGRFLGKCGICKNNIDNGVWPLAKAYEDLTANLYPAMMELELSNQCNLECIMCSGMLSSGIRKNRDKLPPLPMIYTQAFVDELREFVPHLQEMRLNGGEPFAQKIVLDICDMIAEVNPGLKVTVATNGTIMNKRVRHIMKHNNLHLNISIDSLEKPAYETIRVNGDFDKLMRNFEIFREYCSQNSRELSVMVNPMNTNWVEMAEFTRWTHVNDVNLWFNTIRYPEHLAMWNQSSEWLYDAFTRMDKQRWALQKADRNISQFDNLIKQVQNWYLDSLLTE
jgi:MoaA/NifB/PqqE/SkfB family radical SAM enzyme